LRALSSFIDQDDAELRAHPDLFPAAQIDVLTMRTRRIFSRIGPLLLRRGQMGCVRRVHGDLHLANIVLIGDTPVLFDAIEFDPLIASGDVLYDLAFLIMDLMNRGLRKQANIVLNTYLAETRREEDLISMDWQRCHCFFPYELQSGRR